LSWISIAIRQAFAGGGAASNTVSISQLLARRGSGLRSTPEACHACPR
jgi:hypothetical protein